MKFHWGIGIAIVYVIFAGSMVAFAIHASHQHYDLVNDDYYNEAVNYQKTIDAKINSTKADAKVDFDFTPDKRALTITVDGTTKKIAGTLTFYKPDKAADDFKIDFATDESGKQLISLKKLAHGYWKVTATWSINGQDYSEEKRIFSI